jgi:hypothetical protein
VQPTKFELVTNLKALGITVLELMLAIAAFA